MLSGKQLQLWHHHHHHHHLAFAKHHHHHHSSALAPSSLVASLLVCIALGVSLQMCLETTLQPPTAATVRVFRLSWSRSPCNKCTNLTQRCQLFVTVANVIMQGFDSNLSNFRSCFHTIKLKFERNKRKLSHNLSKYWLELEKLHHEMQKCNLATK